MIVTARRFRIVCSLLLLSCLLVVRQVAVVSASSYSVNAVVPYPAPSQAAVFDVGLDGSTVHAALASVSGQCQQQNPATTVVIMRGTINLGSVMCTGTFQLTISLQPGDNTLIARTVNASQLYAPDSQPITISLVLPTPLPPPVVIPNPQAATPAQITTDTNAGAASDLTAWPSQPFSALDTANSVTVHVNVGGGQRPYTVYLNWGDGSNETRTVDQPGSYDFVHNYQATGNYAVHGSVHDVLGAMTQFEYAVVTPKAAAPHATNQTIAYKPTDSLIHRYRSIVAIIIIVLLALASYWFGVRHATKVWQAKVAQKYVLAGKRRAKRPAKKSTS